MNIVKKVLIGIILLVLLLFLTYKLWIVNDEQNQIYIEETKKELESFEKRLFENIEIERTDDIKNDESIVATDHTIEVTNEKPTAATDNTNEVSNNEANEPDEEIDNTAKNQEENIETEAKKEISEIENIYNDAFNNLESKSNQLLENLILQAKNDYSNLTPEEKKSEKVLTKMVADYINRGTQLESQIDEIFYNLLSKMENELITNGFEKDIIKQYKDEYEKRKKTKRGKLMEKAL